MSSYNLKVIEYPNGDIGIRKYSIPQKCKEPKNPYEPEKNYETEPFHGSTAREVDDFDEIKSRSNAGTDAEKAERSYKSYIRTRAKVYDYARCGTWEYFATFTFDAKVVDRYDLEACGKKLRQWLNNQHKRYAPDLQYLIVPEQHKDGAWHFHGIFANIGQMALVDTGHVDKSSRTVFKFEKCRLGFNTLSEVSDFHRVSSYITKYILKSLCQIAPSRQRYYVSKNLPSPKVSTFQLPDDASFDLVLETILDSNPGKSIMSKKNQPGLYTDVLYIMIE